MINRQDLFAAGGALAPNDVAFSDEVYEQVSRSVRMESFGLLPQVIASPSLAGKTTQLHYILQQQRRANVEQNIALSSVDIPANPGGLDEIGLRHLLGQALGTRQVNGTFARILGEAAVDSGDGITVLAITSTENLEAGALRWLLRNILNLEDYRIDKFKVVIDGSFSLETLTTGPNSEYPMAQVVVTTRV